jgi:hypothetical protein
MDVTITARHCTVPDSTAHPGQERLQRLARLTVAPAATRSSSKSRRPSPKAEALVSVPGGAHNRARDR